jgi:hypothetical protein
MAKKRIENLCGCHVENDRIVYCQWHGKVQQMANVLNMLRSYFIKTMGDKAEQSPFIKKIDELIPRQSA